MWVIKVLFSLFIMLIVIFMFILCKDNKKDDTMRDRNVKMWMIFFFLDRNVSDNEMDKKMENI